MPDPNAKNAADTARSATTLWGLFTVLVVSGTVLWAFQYDRARGKY